MRASDLISSCLAIIAFSELADASTRGTLPVLLGGRPMADADSHFTRFKSRSLPLKLTSHPNGPVFLPNKTESSHEAGRSAILESSSPNETDSSNVLLRIPSHNPSNSSSGEAQEKSSVVFKRQNRVKQITDMIIYGFKNHVIQPRTGLLLFGAITAMEIVTVSTLFFGTAGLLVLGAIAMVKLMTAGSFLMFG